MSQKSVSQNVKKKCPQKLFQKKCPKNFPKNRCYCYIKWFILTKVVLSPSVLGVLSSTFWGILGMWEHDLPVFGVRVGFANPPHQGRSTLIIGFRLFASPSPLSTASSSCLPAKGGAPEMSDHTRYSNKKTLVLELFRGKGPQTDICGGLNLYVNKQL